MKLLLPFAVFILWVTATTTADAQAQVPQTHDALKPKVDSLILTASKARRAQLTDSALLIATQLINLGQNAGSPAIEGHGYFSKAITYQGTAQWPAAIEACLTALNRFEQAADTVRIGITQQRLGILYAEQAQPTTAKQYFQQALATWLASQDTVRYANTLNDMGLMHLNQGQFDSAMQYYVESALLKEGLGDTLQLGITYSNIGLLYHLEGRLTEAVEYYEKSLPLFWQARAFIDHARIQLNLAEALGDRGQYAQALQLLASSLAVFEAEGLADLSSYAFATRAGLYYKQGNYSEALADYLALWEDPASLGDDHMLMISYLNAGACYFFLNQFSDAQAAYTRALEDARALNDKQNTAIALYNLAELYDAMGQPQKVFALMQEYDELQAEVFNDERNKAVAEMQEKYNTVVQQREIEQLEADVKLANAESARRRAQFITTLVVGLLLVLLALGFAAYLRQRRKQEALAHATEVKDLLATQETKTLEALVEGQDGERKRLAQELHDHFGNQMAALKVNLRSLNLPQTEQSHAVMGLLDKVTGDIRNLSHSLHAGMEGTFGLMKALEELRDTLNASGALAVELTVTLFSDSFSVKQNIALYRMVQELVSNALKHAEATELAIQVTEFDEDQLINILVQDNGKGFDPALARKRNDGLGMDGLGKRVDEMGGSLDIDSSPGNGTTVMIDIPLTTEQDAQAA